MEDCVFAKSAQVKSGVSFGLILLTAVLAGGVGTLPYINAQAELGVAYGARMACSCHYVSKRPLEACKAELPASAQSVVLEADKAKGLLRAKIGSLYARSAQFTPGYGCVLQP
jgi:hypothetical protein